MTTCPTHPSVTDERGVFTFRLPIPQFESMPKLAAATNALYAQFEDRIDAHDKDARYVRLVPVVGEVAAQTEIYNDKAGI